MLAVCVQFQTPNEKEQHIWPKHGCCLLCLRKYVTLNWGNSNQSDLLSPPINYTQPYRNIIGQPGEYKESACIYTKNAMIGDPFIKYSRHHYYYKKGTNGQTQIGQQYIEYDSTQYFRKGLNYWINVHRGTIVESMETMKS